MGVMWGLLNLIVAAIVESSISAREDDVASAAKMAEQDQIAAWNSFQQLCKGMDADGSGEITVDEFKEYWRTSEELQNHLTIMGVSEKDMDGLLKLMDTDGNGTLDNDEFIEQFTQMRTLIVKTTIFYLLKYVESIRASMSEQGETMENLLEEVTEFKRAFRSNGATASHRLAHRGEGKKSNSKSDEDSDEGKPMERLGTMEPSVEQAVRGEPVQKPSARHAGGARLCSQSTDQISVEPSTSRASGQAEPERVSAACAPTASYRFASESGNYRCGSDSAGFDANSTLPGWYYFGNSPPMDATAFWEQIAPMTQSFPEIRYVVGETKKSSRKRPPILTNSKTRVIPSKAKMSTNGRSKLSRKEDGLLSVQTNSSVNACRVNTLADSYRFSNGLDGVVSGLPAEWTDTAKDGLLLEEENECAEIELPRKHPSRVVA